MFIVLSEWLTLWKRVLVQALFSGIRQSFVANFKLIVYTRKMNNCNVARKFGGGLINMNWTPRKYSSGPEHSHF